MAIKQMYSWKANQSLSIGKSRRWFLRGLISLLFFLFGLIWYRMTGKRLDFLKADQLTITLPPDLPSGISFMASVIVNNSGAKPFILSSHCTHLGCAIKTMKDGNLICSCHGSAFGPDGSVRKGPARKNLRLLSYHVDQKTRKIVVQLDK